MASKKVQNALASTTTPDQILAAAGVEVKLTKSELAEYVKELAIRQLDKQYEEAVKKRDAHEGSIGWGGVTINVDDSSIPARVKRVEASLKENDVEGTSVDLFIDGDAVPRWRVQSAGGNCIHLPFKEGDYPIPSKYAEYRVLDKRLNEIRFKLGEVKNKNYKVLMIENALMSTEAGKLVITNLQQMVENLTKI